jgi:hypothetical protein
MLGAVMVEMAVQVVAVWRLFVLGPSSVPRLRTQQ